MLASIHYRWGKLPPSHRRWIVINGIVIAGLLNFILGGGIAWLSARGAQRVPLWAVPSPTAPNVATDTVGTLFFLPLITCLILTTIVWRQLRSGAADSDVYADSPSSLLDRLPLGPLRKGAILGGLSAVALSPLTLAVLALADFDGVSPAQFALFKAILGTVLGVLVTPLVALLGATYPRPAKLKKAASAV